MRLVEFFSYQLSINESAGNIQRLLGFSKFGAEYIHSLFGPFDFTAAKLILGAISGAIVQDKKSPDDAVKNSIDYAIVRICDYTNVSESDDIVKQVADIKDFLKTSPAAVSKINSSPPDLSFGLLRGIVISKQVDRSKVFMELENGWKWINLGTCNDAAEGQAMQHCGRDTRGNLFSLRDPKNTANVTMTYNADKNVVYQIKGKQNREPTQQLWPAVKAFFEKTGAQQKDSNISLELDDFITGGKQPDNVICQVGKFVWIEIPDHPNEFVIVTKSIARSIDDGSDYIERSEYNTTTLEKGVLRPAAIASDEEVAALAKALGSNQVKSIMRKNK